MKWISYRSYVKVVSPKNYGAIMEKNHIEVLWYVNLYACIFRNIKWNIVKSLLWHSTSAHHPNITISGSSLIHCIFSLEGVLQHLAFCPWATLWFWLGFYVMHKCVNIVWSANTTHWIKDSPLSWKRFFFLIHLTALNYMFSAVLIAAGVFWRSFTVSLALSLCFRHHSPPGFHRRPLGSSTNKPSAWISFWRE